MTISMGASQVREDEYRLGTEKGVRYVKATQLTLPGKMLDIGLALMNAATSTRPDIRTMCDDLRWEDIL